MMQKKSFRSIGSALVAQKTVKNQTIAKFGDPSTEDEFHDRDNQLRKEGDIPWIIIRCDSHFRFWWDFAQCLILSYVSIYVPVTVSFEIQPQGIGFWIDIFVDLYFYIDIVLNFLTSYKVERDLDIFEITSLKGIAYNYMVTWLLLDILACFPLDYISRATEGTLMCSLSLDGCSKTGGTAVVGPDGELTAAGEEDIGEERLLRMLKVLRLFRLLKMIRLVRVSRLLNRYRDELVYWAHLVVLLKLVLTITLTSHWLGCLYGATFNWGDENLYEKYVWSFYWAVQTTTTVGYGDLNPEKISSLLVAVLAMSVGGFTFSWLVSNIFSVLNPDPQKKEMEEQMSWTVGYLRTNNIPSEMASRVLSFYRKKGNFNFDERRLLATLPALLRREICDQLFTETVTSVKIFKKFAIEELFVKELCLLLYSAVFFQWEMVYSRNDNGTDMYIVADGALRLMSDLDPSAMQRGVMVSKDLRSMLAGQGSHSAVTSMRDATLIRFGPGDVFGEAAVFGHHKRIDFVIATTNAKVLTIPGERFRVLLSQYPRVRTALLECTLDRLVKTANRANQLACLQSMNMPEIVDSEGLLRRDYKQLLMDMEKENPALEKPSTPLQSLSFSSASVGALRAESRGGYSPDAAGVLVGDHAVASAAQVAMLQTEVVELKRMVARLAAIIDKHH